MSTETKPADPAPVPPQMREDLPESDRKALLQETLRSLQEAFSVPGDEDDAGTTTELNQNAAEAASDPMEPLP